MSDDLTAREWAEAAHELGNQALALYARCPQCCHLEVRQVNGCCRDCAALWWAAQMLCSPADREPDQSFTVGVP